MKSNVAASLFLVLTSLALPYETRAQKLSEETAPFTCGSRLMSSVQCAGGFCDDLTVGCSTNEFISTNRKWERWISDETPYGAGCFYSESRPGTTLPQSRYSGFISGMACRGQYCDEISIECVKLRDFEPASGPASCVWSPWISEERAA